MASTTFGQANGTHAGAARTAEAQVLRAYRERLVRELAELDRQLEDLER